MKAKFFTTGNILVVSAILSGVALGGCAIAQSSAGIAASVLTANTASDPKAEAQAKILSDVMQKSLALTPEQYPVVYLLNLKYLAGDSSTAKKAEQAIAKEAEFKAALTPEQFGLYQLLKDSMSNAALNQMQKLKK